MIRQAEHSRVAAFGDLYDVARFLVHGHGLAADAVRAKHDPFAVGGPLMMRRIDFRITRGRAGEKGQRHAGDRILHDFHFGGKTLTDLGVGRSDQPGARNEHDGRQEAERFFHGTGEVVTKMRTEG